MLDRTACFDQAFDQCFRRYDKFFNEWAENRLDFLLFLSENDKLMVTKKWEGLFFCFIIVCEVGCHVRNFLMAKSCHHGPFDQLIVAFCCDKKCAQNLRAKIILVKIDRRRPDNCHSAFHLRLDLVPYLQLYQKILLISCWKIVQLTTRAINLKHV